jgi:ribonuclease Z
MAKAGLFAETLLVNGSAGDPVLYLDYPDRDDALLLDAGDNSALSLARLADLTAVFITHHHIDHFIGLDRIVRANMDREKTLSLFGPPGTIAKVVDRIRSYEFQFFPFQKIVIDVCEIEDRTLRRGHLDCGRRFPPPVIEETPRTGPVVFENDTIAVEACAADHTVPCLSYAVIEKPGWFLDQAALQKSQLKPGPWIGEILSRLRRGDDLASPVKIDDGEFPWKAIVQRLFRRSTGSRLAFITDTAWTETVRPQLLALAHRATRLYCDAFYSQKHADKARQHRHLTAQQAGELARLARVEELVLMHFSQRYAGRYEPLLEEARTEFPGATAVFP